MTATTDGIVSTEFSSDILTDLGQTLSYQVVTRTTNGMTGEETSSYATASNVTGIFFLHENKHIWDKEGLLQDGDAYIIVPTSVGAKRYDKFTISSTTYYVENVTRRTVLTTAMADFCVCFRVA